MLSPKCCFRSKVMQMTSRIWEAFGRGKIKIMPKASRLLANWREDELENDVQRRYCSAEGRFERKSCWVLLKATQLDSHCDAIKFNNRWAIRIKSRFDSVRIDVQMQFKSSPFQGGESTACIFRGKRTNATFPLWNRSQPVSLSQAPSSKEPISSNACCKQCKSEFPSR